MLIALLAAYFLSGGAGPAAAILTPAAVEEIAKEVRAEVDDAERAAEADQVLAEIKRESKSFEKVFSKSGKELTRLYKEHDADVEEMAAVLQRLNENWAAAQSRAVDLRFELRDSLTEEEWRALFDDG